MPRLVTFGCSHTWGVGLPDVYPRVNDSPSDFAWPKILSNKLGYELDNRGAPGAGNAEILYNVLNYDFKENDYCIIMWAHFVRFRHQVFTNDYQPLRRWIKPEHLTLEVMEFFQQTNAYNNFLAFHHAYLYLKSKNIPSITFMAEKVDYQEFNKPNFLDIPNLILINHGNYRLDNALDDMHFGIKSHEKLADILYNKINT